MSTSSDSSFAKLLDTVRVEVDASLASWLRPRVEAAHRISAEVGDAAAAAESLALRGGKRMRAALVVAGYEACGAERGSAVDPAYVRALLGPTGPAAIAIELLQVYLLIHDDWMDDDPVRRGGPSVHVLLRERLGDKRLGDTAAILAGDLVSGYAQSALLETPLDAARVLGAARAFAQIQEDVVCGQLAEISPMIGDRAKGTPPSVELIHALKTASYTVTGPIALGARLAGASEARVASLGRYGRALGVAFQLRDDLLGVFGDAESTGKPVGNDIRQGKRTTLVSETEKDPSARALLARVLGDGKATEADVAKVVDAMIETGARSRVERRVSELLAESRAALASLELPEASAGRQWLFGAVSALGERTK